MERLRRCAPRLRFWGWLLGGGWLLLSGVGVRAQVGSGSRAKWLAQPGASLAASGAAQVYTLPASGEALRFEVPQVQLASKVLARRVNRQLLRYALQSAEGIDTLALPTRQLQQAARDCCYDGDTRHWQVGQGLTHCGYRILFNQGNLLSLAITEEFTGAYSWERDKHITFDLSTGRQLTLRDVVADAPAQLQQRLGWAVSRRLGEALAATVDYYGDEPATIVHVAEQFQWDWATHRTAIGEGADLTDFALTPQKLLLFFQVGFAHIESNFEPDATYRFAYAILHPQPRLRRALRLPPSRPLPE